MKDSVSKHNLQNTEHEESDDSHLLPDPELQMLHLHHRQGEHTQVNDEMHQDRSEEELRVVNVAHLILDVVIPKCLDGDAMEYGHERPDDKPDDRTAGKYLDRETNVGRLEETPVEPQNRELGEGQGEGVEDLGVPKEETGHLQDVVGVHVDVFKGAAETSGHCPLSLSV